MNLKRLINTVLLLLTTMLLAACGGPTKVESDLGLDDAPDWVNEGSQALSDDDGRLIHGVGMATDIGDLSLQKTTADNRARAEVAAVLATFMDNVATDFSYHNGSQNMLDIKRVIKSNTRVLLTDVRIIARWRDPETKTLYSLAELDFEQVKKRGNKITTFPSDFRRFIDSNSNKLFDRYVNLGR